MPQDSFELELLDGKEQSSGGGNTVSIFQAVREGALGVVQSLVEKFHSDLQRKKQINRQDENKLSLLHYAARYHDYDMIKYLINRGADVHSKGDDDLLTPLHMLAKYKYKDSNNKKTNDEAQTTDSLSDTEDTIDQSVEFKCVSLLVTSGARINGKDSSG